MKIFSGKLKNQKRGSLQLSINAIVILILAITLLGLGLGFIKGIFKGTLGKLTKIEEQLGEEERKTLLDSSSEITLLSSRIKVEGRETDLNFAIRNNRPNWLRFSVMDGFDCFDAIGVDASAGLQKSIAEGNPWIAFETYESREIEGTKADIVPLKIRVSADAVPTIYSCKLTLKIVGEEADPQNKPGEIAEGDGGTYAVKRFEIEYVK